jgi:hypothetical protein
MRKISGEVGAWGGHAAHPSSTAESNTEERKEHVAGEFCWCDNTFLIGLARADSAPQNKNLTQPLENKDL